MPIVVEKGWKPSSDPMGLYRGRQQSSGPALEGNPDNQFNTPLTETEETAFQEWKARLAPEDSGEDYDLRGAFKAGLEPGEDGHWDDAYKKPNHPTFSTRSRYSQYDPDRAGTWDGATYVPSPKVAEERARAEAEATNRQVATEFETLEGKSPGRYAVISENDFADWKADWDKKYQSTGFLGDTVRLLDAGVAGVEQGINELVGQIPGIGKPLQDLADAFDSLAYGSPSMSDRLEGVIEHNIATLTPEMRDAREKPWWDAERGSLGAAWLDPKSYYAGLVESLPGTVLTMAPAMALARGAYLGALAKGATDKIAAAAAAKTALVAGAITEGGLGGGQAGVSVRQSIARMPAEELAQTSAVQALVAQGMSVDEAIQAITDDAATQALIMGGVATGMFGGFGDRFLAKLIAEGVGGTVARRLVEGATRGIVAEGLLEEMPQEGLSQLGQNLALKNTVDPNKDVFEDVPNAALGGVAVGGVMGGGLGAAGGAARPAEAAPTASAPVPPAPPPAGPLAAARDYGMRTAPSMDPVLTPIVEEEADPVAGETTILDGEDPVPTSPVNPHQPPRAGSTVFVEAEGLARFKGKIEQYVQEGDDFEALVSDVESGEVWQVPVTSLQVASLSAEQIAERDAAADPPLVREPIETPAEVSRDVHGHNMVLPDDRHAQLFDYGEQRRLNQSTKRVIGGDILKANEALDGRRQALADLFEIPPDRVNELADDYRYRVERVARGSKSSGLPVNVHEVPDKLLLRFQKQRLKAERDALLNKGEGLEPDSNTPALPLEADLLNSTSTVAIDAAAAEAATSPANDLPEPTQAQKEAGNYKLGHAKVGGLDVSIENPAGSERKGVDKGGKAWSVQMKHHYGYIKRTEGKDGDHVDVFVKKGTVPELADDAPVFVVDQVVDGKFDEHKVMLGFETLGQAKKAYLANYMKGWKGLGAITPTTLGEFKTWLEGDTTKEFAKTSAPKPLSRRQEDGPADANMFEGNEPEPTPLQQALDDEAAELLEKLTTYAQGVVGPALTAVDLVGSVAAKGRGNDVDILYTLPAQDLPAGEAAGEALEAVLEPIPGLDIERYDSFFRVGDRYFHLSWGAGGAIIENTDYAKEQAGKPVKRLAEWTPQQDEDNDTVEQRLTADGPWDFNDTYPEPDRQQVTRLDTEGRESYPHDDDFNFDVEAVATSLEEALQELEIHHLDTYEARRQINEITAGRQKVKGSTTEALKRLETSIENDKRDIADLLAAHADVFPEAAVTALRKEAVARAQQRWAQMDKGAQTRIPKTERKAPEKETPRDLQQEASQIYAKMLKRVATAEPNPKLHLLREQLAEQVDNPERYHRVVEEKNSKGIKIGDEIVHANREPGLAASINTQGSTQGVLFVAPDGYPVWYPVEDVEKASSGKKPREPERTIVPPAVAKEITEKAKPAPASKNITENITGPAEPFAKNKLFTADKVAAAKARLKSKMGQLNSGIDPEVLIDGMTIAGAYIEAGVRTFADYAKQMTGDFGDGIKPYLLSFWEGARNYPGLDTKGMTSVAESAAAHAALVTTLPASEAAPIGTEVAKPAKRTKKSGRTEDRTLTQDWGVEHVDGYGNDPSREEGNDVKDAFLKDGVAYLRAVSEALEREGFTPQEDRRGRPMKAVSKNEAGVAVSGDVTMTMRHPDSGASVYASLGGSALRGVVPTTPSGVALMYRVSTKAGDTYAVAGPNRWMQTTLSAGEFAAIIAAEAKGTRPALAREEVPHEPSELDQSGSAALEGSPSGEVPGAAEVGDAGKRTDEGRRGDPAGSDGARGQRDAAGRGVAAGQGTLFDPARGADLARLAEDSAATPAQLIPADFTITDADDVGAGGAKTKFRNNVAAIRLVRELEEAGRSATREEQSVLAKWVGWGGLSAAFPRENGAVPKGWEKEAAELKALLSEDEYQSAAASTRNAHYTATEVVEFMWKAVDRLGFKHGKVLEPSIGAGNFIGMMPATAREQSQITGVELEKITGSIAKHLYPRANVKIAGFQDFTVPDDYFDLAIGNPPFGSERLYDPQRRKLNKFSIHNFFFAKSIDALRPGGVLAMVVTNFFLDAKNAAARNYIADRADLVAAIRLPNDAFLANAGTEVTTDIIILRKRAEGEAAGDRAWTETGLYTDTESREVPLNSYFLANRSNMLGEFGLYGTMYGAAPTPALISTPGQDLPKLLESALARLPQGIIAPAAADPAPEVVAVDVGSALVNSMFVGADGAVMIRVPDHLGDARAEKVELPNEKAGARIIGMIGIRDIFTELRKAQVEDYATDEQLAALRKSLNAAYDTFVAKHGHIHSDANRRLFRDDPTWPQLAALEDKWDRGISKDVAARTGEAMRAPSAKKAAIFTIRTQQPYARPTTAATAKDALAAVLADRGYVDLDEMSRLYAGASRDALLRELGDLVYATPEGSYQTADEYLGGNVKMKLEAALAAAERDPEYKRNVEALRAVIPADIEPVDIDVKPGAGWIPSRHIVDFIGAVAQTSATATYIRALNRWAIQAKSIGPAAEAQWGTRRVAAEEVIDALINARPITVYDVASDGSRSVNVAETDAANEKLDKLKAEWSRWIWEDDARRDELARLYNDTFNTDVLRRFDGSHLKLPGKVDYIALRPHQLDFIWRGLQTNTILADHTVGAGKTFAAIALIMEKRRMRQAAKPMLAVPNHLVGQWAADFIKLYPGAKVLAPTKADFEGPNRRKLFARIATGDWDAVIVAHSSFKYLPVDPQFEQRFIEQQIEDIESSIGEVRAAEGKNDRTVKQLQKQRENLRSKLTNLLNAGAKDELGMTFEDMGIDALFVDEAHEFKNLGFSTSMQRVAGLGNAAGSQKAADLYIKVTSVLERTGGRNVAFLTGTPISNTMAEMYTMQRYLDNEALRRLGIAHFDAWARVFGEVVTDFTLSPSGKYKQTSKFAKFVNMPELMQRYRAFADVITNDDIQRQLAARGERLPIPKIKGGAPRPIVVDRSPVQARYMGEGKMIGDQEVWNEGSLVYRAEHLPKRPGPGDDNMLKITSDARKAALDMRLISPEHRDFSGSKVNKAAENIFRIYQEWNEQRGTQLVFIDLSTPKKARAKEEARLKELMQKAEAGDEAAAEAIDNMSPDEFLALNGGFSVYDDLKDKLVAMGVPEREIAFIHDANTDAQKQELFGKVQSGTVRIMFGSTPKMGAGTNVQNRLVALHHLDAPWRPSDLEQRDGRGVRQGNELYAADPDGFELEILRYGTKNSLDSWLWEIIEGKAKFIAQIRKGDLKDRVVEDVSGEAANAAVMKAATSGNPLILEEITLKQKVRKLEGAQSEHDRGQHRVRFEIKTLRGRNEKLAEEMPQAVEDERRAKAFAEAPLDTTIAGQHVEKPKELGAAILAAGRALKDGDEPSSTIKLGKLGEFDLTLEHQADKVLGEIRHQFDIVIKGSREHSVDVADIDDASDVGTAMRVLNTIRDLAKGPTFARERIAANERELAALERQIKPWDGAEELATTKARHSEVIAKLRPKEKPPAPAPAAVTPPPADAEYSAADMEPVATLSGDEIGDGRDLNALRRNALRWYGDNLVGEAVKTADGVTVLFNQAGARESTGNAGATALQAVPALAEIIRKGHVVRRYGAGRPSPESAETVGSRLAEIREARAWSQAQFAHQLNLSPQRYGQYERDQRSIPHDVLDRIWKLTGANADFILFGRTGGMPVDLMRVMRNPQDAVKERLVIAAPVRIAGRVHQMAVTINRTDDGRFHYDIMPAPQTETGDFDAGTGTPAGWNIVESETDAPVGLTDAQRAELSEIVRTVSGLSEAEYTDRLTMPAGNAGWGNDAPRSAAGLYSPERDLVLLAEDSATERTAYHEAFHRVQRLFLTDAERKILKSDAAKLRRIVNTFEFRRGQADKMSQKELEAEAFAIWATGKSTVKPYKGIAAAWERIKTAMERIANLIRGWGFETSEDIFARAAAGTIARRSGKAERQISGKPDYDATDDPAFDRWFAKSKVVDESGKPLRVYHGTAARTSEQRPVDFDVFKTHQEMGAHFGTIEQAENRVGDAGERNPIRFYPVYLSIQNPLRVRDVGEFSFDTLATDLGDRGIIENADDWLDRYNEVADGDFDALDRLNGEFKEHLKDLGYDGLVYLNRGESNVDPMDPDVSNLDDEAFREKVPNAADSWVAFDATQIKSAIANRGTYSPTDPRIQFSAADVAPAASVASAGKKVAEEAKGTWTDVQPKLLAAVPLTYFKELARPNMSAVSEYLRFKREMDAFRGSKHGDADVIAQEWLKFIRTGFGLLPSKEGKAAAAKLSDLMHDATLSGVDPSSTDIEHERHPAYPALRARYIALAPKGQKLFRVVRDAYKSQAKELDDLLVDNVRKSQQIAMKRADEQFEVELDRIRQSNLTGPELKQAIDEASDRFARNKIRSSYANKARLTQLRKAFENSRVPEPYFPLARFGRYFVTVRDLDGTVISFSRKEKAADRDRLATQLRNAYPGRKVETGVIDEAGAGLREAMDPRIVAEIQGILSEGGVDAAVMDAIWQRYLQSMPDLSTRKRFIHRKGTSGYDADALRVFSSHMFHSAHQMARLKYGVDLQEMLDQTALQARAADDPTRAMTLANELAQRHKWVMNPTGSSAAQFVTSAMFVWYLAATPAAALVNLTQTPMLGIPILGARYGVGKAGTQLLRASKQFVTGKGTVGNNVLTEDERWALDKMYESGLVDRTQSHDLAGVGDTGVRYSPLRSRVMAIISWGFHKAEVLNREVTAMAAYRLAREAGEDPKHALESAHDLTWKIHFDYSNASRPRLLQGDVAKVLLVFQNFQLNMWYRIFRDIHQSLKGETPQARKEARYQLAGIIGMMTLFGGVTGMFGFHLLMAIAGLFFADDDDPFDFETQMSRHVLDLFGPDVGGMILKGVPGHLLGIDLTSRVGMPDIFVRAPDDPNLDGRDWMKEFIVGALGVVPNTLINAVDGVGLIQQGKTFRGLELLAPKAIKDVMQAYRFANEGLTNRRGDELLPRDQFDAYTTIVKMIGFTPAKVAETYDRNSALYAAEGRIQEERSALLNQFAAAMEMQDDETRARVLDRIRAFNAKPANRPVAITADTIKRSLAARRRNAQKREDGVLIPNEGLSRTLRGLQPDRIN